MRNRGQWGFVMEECSDRSLTFGTFDVSHDCSFAFHVSFCLRYCLTIHFWESQQCLRASYSQLKGTCRERDAMKAGLKYFYCQAMKEVKKCSIPLWTPQRVKTYLSRTWVCMKGLVSFWHWLTVSLLKLDKVLCTWLLSQYTHFLQQIIHQCGEGPFDFLWKLSCL